MRNSAIAVSLLAILPACDQQPAAPGIQAAPALARAAVDPNKNQVIRYQDHFAQSWTDANSSLRATHTTFPIPIGDPPEAEPDCGPQAELGMINFQQVGVENPVDFFASEFHINASGPVWVIVRDLSQPGDCYGVKLIAQGPGQIRYLDNDAFGALPGQTKANSWGFIASGTLTRPDGTQVSYQGTARYVIKATDDPDAPRVLAVVERVTLR
jgi:hypothetical protein